MKENKEKTIDAMKARKEKKEKEQGGKKRISRVISHRKTEIQGG